jgi:hypothetical protein
VYYWVYITVHILLNKTLEFAELLMLHYWEKFTDGITKRIGVTVHTHTKKQESIYTQKASILLNMVQ